MSYDCTLDDDKDEAQCFLCMDGKHYRCIEQKRVHSAYWFPVPGKIDYCVACTCDVCCKEAGDTDKRVAIAMIHALRIWLDRKKTRKKHARSKRQVVKNRRSHCMLDYSRNSF